MVSKNDITGDNIQTKGLSKSYEDNWDRIFAKKDMANNKNILNNYTDNQSHTIDISNTNTITQEK